LYTFLQSQKYVAIYIIDIRINNLFMLHDLVDDDILFNILQRQYDK